MSDSFEQEVNSKINISLERNGFISIVKNTKIQFHALVDACLRQAGSSPTRIRMLTS